MKKIFTLVLAVGLICGVQAQKKVAYISKVKALDAGTATITTEPCLTILANDPNFTVELIRCNTTDFLEADGSTVKTVDLSTYDVIVIQQCLGGADPIVNAGPPNSGFTTVGKLGLATLPKPTLYNLQFAFKSGRALFSNGAGGVDATNVLELTVPVASQTNDLFKGIDFAGGTDIKMFNVNTTDGGTSGLSGSTKGLNCTNSTTIDPANSVLAYPKGYATAQTCINDIPAGTIIGGVILSSRIITFGYNYGAIINSNGTNITPAALTIWRNAVYMLAGLPVPNSPVTAIGKGPKISENIYSAEDGITLDLKAPSMVTIYSVDGKVVAKKMISGKETVPCGNGLYIVKTNGTAVKVMVK